MKKNKKIYIKLLIFIISLYAIFTLISQQNTLNQYSKNSQELSQKIKEEKQEKEELAKKRRCKFIRIYWTNSKRKIRYVLSKWKGVYR